RTFSQDPAHVGQRHLQIGLKALEGGEIAFAPPCIQAEVQRTLVSDYHQCTGYRRRDRNLESYPTANDGSDKMFNSPCGKQNREEFKGRLKPVQMKLTRDARQHKQMTPGGAAEE